MDRSPPSLEHRHKRRALWAALWLARLIRILSGFSQVPMPDVCRQAFGKALDLLARLVVFLVLIRAAQLKAPGAKVRNGRRVALAMRRHDVRVMERGGMRAAIGGALRRAVKARGTSARDFQARAEKLLGVLMALESWAARLAHRARNGLTRLLELHTGIELQLPLRHPAGGSPLQISLGEELRVALAPP